MFLNTSLFVMIFDFAQKGCYQWMIVFGSFNARFITSVGDQNQITKIFVAITIRIEKRPDCLFFVFLKSNNKDFAYMVFVFLSLTCKEVSNNYGLRLFKLLYCIISVYDWFIRKVCHLRSHQWVSQGWLFGHQLLSRRTLSPSWRPLGNKHLPTKDGPLSI